MDDSEECANSSLSLFDKQSVQTDIIKSSIVDYFPVTSITSGGPIEFEVPGNSEEYIDVNDINLHIKFKITKKNGADIEAADKVGLNNLAIATLFQDAILTIGETQVEGGQQTYPYSAYLHTVTQFQPQAQASHTQLQGWQKIRLVNLFMKQILVSLSVRNELTVVKFVLYGPLFFYFTQ